MLIKLCLMNQGEHAPNWTFLSNHAHVLICLSRDGDMRMRELASIVGITERAVQRIISELIGDGYLQRKKNGRRNHYTVNGDIPLRHPVESSHHVGELLRVLT